MIKLNFVFKNVKNLLLALFLIFCLTISLGLLYLNRFNVSITNITFSKKNPVVFYDSWKRKSVNIKVEKFDRITLNQVPLLIRKVIVKREGFVRSRLKFKDIIRSLVIDIRGGMQGFYDPDITAKLAHNSLVINKKKWPLGLEEKFLAEKLRKKYNKDQILERYLNQIYFGQGIFGFEAASDYYFREKVSNLKTHQIALLLCLNRTGFYSGTMDEVKTVQKNYIQLRKSRNSMLDFMLDCGLISVETSEELKRKPLDLVLQLKG